MTVADLETLGPGPEEVEAPRDSSGKKITGRSPTKIALERLRKDKVALLAGGIVLMLVLAAIFAPLICKLFGIGGPYDTKGVAELDLATGGYPAVGPPFHPFTWDHPLGITRTRRYDNLSRLLYGLRVSLGIALGATFFTTLIGIVMGLLAGYTRGWPTDHLLHDRPLPVVPVPAGCAGSGADHHLPLRHPAGQAQVGPVLRLMSSSSSSAGCPGSADPRPGALAARARVHPGRPGARRTDLAHPVQELLPNLIAPIVVSTSLILPAFVAAEAGLSLPRHRHHRLPVARQTILRASDYYKKLPPVLLCTGVDRHHPRGGAQPAGRLDPRRLRPQDSSLTAQFVAIDAQPTKEKVG